MKRKTLRVFWLPSMGSSSRIYSVPHSCLYGFLALFVISWLLLGMGGYFGKRLYQDNTQLRGQNSDLRQKEEELNALRHAMEKMQKDENLIRSFLGPGSSQTQGGLLGLGGEASPDLSAISLEDVMTISSTPPVPVSSGSGTLVERAQALQHSLRELVQAIQNQRQYLNSTPSIVPVAADKYRISSGFGWRRNPFSVGREFHNGVDIWSVHGTPIITPADGAVYERDSNKYLGRFLRIDHGKGITTTYGHLSGVTVLSGQKVKRGEVIGFMGNSGRSVGTHLHYTVRVGGRCVDPLHYMLNTGRNRVVELVAKGEGGVQ